MQGFEMTGHLMKALLSSHDCSWTDRVQSANSRTRTTAKNTALLVFEAQWLTQPTRAVVRKVMQFTHHSRLLIQ